MACPLRNKRCKQQAVYKFQKGWFCSGYIKNPPPDVPKQDVCVFCYKSKSNNWNIEQHYLRLDEATFLSAALSLAALAAINDNKT